MLERVTYLSHLCFTVENSYFTYTDCYHFDDFGLPEYLVNKLDSWANSFWAAEKNLENFDIAQHNRIGLEIAREIKPYIADRGKFKFTSIVSLEALPNGRKIVMESMDV